MAEVTRPVLRYHGGKWRLAPWIISHFPAHRVYVEPYGGAASVLLRKPRVYSEVYNDLDGEIVNLFRVLRNPSQARELQRLVELTPCARQEFDDAVLLSGDPIEQARRTLIRHWFAYATGQHRSRNKVFRSHATGNHPVAPEWGRYPAVLAEITARLRGVMIENAPALDVLTRYDGQGVLFYCDPPYVLGTRAARQAGNVYQYEMTDDEHVRLAEALHQVVGAVVLSGYDSEMYRELYGDWRRVERDAVADGGVKRTEVLWLSPNVATQKGLFD